MFLLEARISPTYFYCLGTGQLGKKKHREQYPPEKTILLETKKEQPLERELLFSVL